MSLACCVHVEREKARLDTAALVRVVRGSLPSGRNREGLSTVARRAGGPARSSCEASAGLATMINPVVAGWMQYYGRFRRSALSPLLARINAYLVRWIRKKYNRLQGAHKANRKLAGITRRYPPPPLRALAMGSLSLDVIKTARAV